MALFDAFYNGNETEHSLKGVTDSIAVAKAWETIAHGNSYTETPIVDKYTNLYSL